VAAAAPAAVSIECSESMLTNLPRIVPSPNHCARVSMISV
jgi:hypothetical protein